VRAAIEREQILSERYERRKRVQDLRAARLKGKAKVGTRARSVHARRA
jgi:hypothetical protein